MTVDELLVASASSQTAQALVDCVSELRARIVRGERQIGILPIAESRCLKGEEAVLEAASPGAGEGPPPSPAPSDARLTARHPAPQRRAASTEGRRPPATESRTR
jgi:hypothetical protein